MPKDAHQCFPSPLRYPGGKGKVANYFKLLFLENDLVGQHYAELYAGGASVALSLLYEEFASHIHINDLNKSIHAFWYAVLNQPDDLCRLINDTAVTIEEWYRQRAVQDDESASPLELAFSTFFLNRTNHSGIVNGGVIGGQQQLGEWKLDARYNKADLICRIKKIARHRNRITLTGQDAADYIRTLLPRLPAGTLSYLDPPYYVKGEGLYEHFYQHDDHVAIAALMHDAQHEWIVSYDAVANIRNLYTDFDRIEYTLSYSAAIRQRGNEAMFFSPNLRQPDVVSPAHINSSVIYARQAAIASGQQTMDIGL